MLSLSKTKRMYRDMTWQHSRMRSAGLLDLKSFDMTGKVVFVTGGWLNYSSTLRTLLSKLPFNRKRRDRQRDVQETVSMGSRSDYGVQKT